MTPVKLALSVAVIGATAVYVTNRSSASAATIISTMAIPSAASGAPAPAAAPAPSASSASSSARSAPFQQAGGKRLIVPAGGRGGFLSPGILVGNTLYMSGQLPAGNLRDSSIVVQTRSVIERTKPILEAAGMTLADVVSIQAYLIDMADYNGFNTAYREFFTAEPTPTRTTVVVKELVQGAKVELTMTAVKAP